MSGKAWPCNSVGPWPLSCEGKDWPRARGLYKFVEVPQISARLNPHPFSPHIHTHLQRAALHHFSFNMCDKLGLLMGVGGNSNCHSPGVTGQNMSGLVIIKDMESGAKLPRLKCWLCLFLVIRTWAIDLTSFT